MHYQLERMTGIEPALSAWEAEVLPLNYIRVRHPEALPCIKFSKGPPVRIWAQRQTVRLGGRPAAVAREYNTVNVDGVFAQQKRDRCGKGVCLDRIGDDRHAFANALLAQG